MTLKDLPPPGTKRWVIRRKAEVVAGVRAGLLTLIDRHGLRGLRVTRLQDYRGERAARRGRPETPTRRTVSEYPLRNPPLS